MRPAQGSAIRSDVPPAIFAAQHAECFDEWQAITLDHAWKEQRPGFREIAGKFFIGAATELDDVASKLSISVKNGEYVIRFPAALADNQQARRLIS